MINDLNKSIKDIKHELQNNFSKAPPIVSLSSILKYNGISYIVLQLAPKTDNKIRFKVLIGAREIKLMTV